MRNIHYINAGAGSGKTHELTEKLVSHIKDGDCRPSEVILTTFTDLAASEFRQKAYDALVKVSRYDDAAQLDAATIGTVHSVALKYVQKYWYLLGLGSKMNVLTEEDKKIFISATVGEAITDKERFVLKEFDDIFSKYGYKSEDKWIKVLTDILNEAQTFNVKSLEESKKYSLDFIKDFFNEKPVDIPVAGIKSWLADYRAICKRGDKYGNPYMDHIAIMDRVKGKLDNYAALAEVYNMMSKPKRAEARKLPGYAETFEALGRVLRSSTFQEPITKCCETIFNLAIKVDCQFDEFKTRKGLIEYNDMEKYFIRLLDNDIVKEDISRSVKYVFVDEFQDSNPTQIEIFRKLSELVTKSYWVGDPKQSIYAFRGSAPEVVMDVARKIVEGDGAQGFSHQNLQYSWRTGKNLVEFDSAVACALFSDAAKYPQPGLEHAPKGNSFNASCPVIHWDAQDGEQTHVLGQKLIEVMKDMDLQPKDIAILIRKKEDVTNVARILRAEGLPVSSPEVFLPQRAETQLLFALLKFILLKDNHTKAELASLILNRHLPEIIEHKDDVLKAFDGLRFNEILDRIKHQSVPDIVDTIIDEMDLRGLCSKWGDSANRQANLDALQAQAREYDKRCIQLGLGSSLDGFIEYVKGLDLPPKSDNSDNGIKVMTYHGAKGLEWRMVILYSLWSDVLHVQTIRSRFVFNVQIVKQPDGNLLRYIPDFRPTDKSGIPSFILEKPEIQTGLDQYIENEKEECKRLLYVGFTRARDYLVTIAYPGKSFKWLTAVGLKPPQVSNISQGKACIWGTDFPQVDVQTIVGDGTEKYTADNDFCTWYRPVVDVPDRGQKVVNPSKLEGTSHAEIVMKHDIAPGITVTGAFSATEMGTCIHNYFAAHDTGSESNLLKARRLVQNFGLGTNITEPGQMVESATRLFKWFEGIEGPTVALLREVPFCHRTTSGQTVIGEIDLVVEKADKHCFLVDYKNTHDEGDHSSQLMEYKTALEEAKYHVDKVYVFYPLKGYLVELSLSAGA